MSMQPQINTGFAQEKLYAMAHKAQQQQANQEVAPKEQQVEQTKNEQLTSLVWETVDGKDGAKSFDLRGKDVVYLTSISSALAEDEVDAVSNRKKLKFRDRAEKILKDKMVKLAMDCFSHNFFVAELSKMGVGIISGQLSMLGVSPAEIKELMSQAKREKMAAVNTGLKQVASEKVLFGLVTGARIA